MGQVRRRGEKIRGFIIQNVAENPSDIVALTSKKFDISRQAVNAHIKRLVSQDLLIAEGNTRRRTYKLRPESTVTKDFELDGLAEDAVWRAFVAPNLTGLPNNVIDIWNYGFTEMLNNAVDHSEGSAAFVTIEKNPAFTEIRIADNGEGIFRRIRRMLKLQDERHAVLELSKGKLTTDPDHHTGEGIYFSSRSFDKYAILSGDVYFTHESGEPEEWILETQRPRSGTTVVMRLSNNSSRTLKSVFDKYASSSEYGFEKTVVPVWLARYGNERLVSRSQAKRLLARVDRFRIVIFDFSDIDRIGQAFADEVFRVFQNKHPEIQIYFIQANSEVEDMIIRALGADGT